MKNYGSAIKKLRKNADITQAQLAQKLNVSSQTVSKWENGVNLPDISAIEDICALFGVSLEEFSQLADGGVSDTSAPAVTEVPATTPVLAAPAAAVADSRRKYLWVIILVVVLYVLIVASSIIGVGLTVVKPLFNGLFGSGGDGGTSGKTVYERVNPSVFCITVQTEDNTLSGSGFFIGSDGTAVTNYHVIDGIKSAKVKLYDGEEYEVDKILGHDTVRDIAIIHVNASKTPYVKLADSDRISTGDKVYAIGYPESFVLGSLDSTMTDGIISKTSYSVGGVRYIQSTVDITHGNSGGVLLNAKGEVIGITTAGIDLGSITYMNLSVPSNAIKGVKRNIDMSVENYAAEYSRRITVTYILDGMNFAVKTVCAAESVPNLAVDFTALGEEYSDCIFLGWYADSGYAEPFDFKSAVAAEDFTLYGKLRFKKTVVEYSLQSDTVVTEEGDTLRPGESFTLPENKYVRTGFNFSGWKIDGKSYAPGDEINVEGTVRKLTVEADWTGVVYTVRFGYDGQQYDEEYRYADTHRLPAARYTRVGYNQTGWNYNGTDYGLRATVTDFTSEEGAVVTLTPVWTAITYSLRLEFGNDVFFYMGKEYQPGEYAFITGTYGEDPLPAAEAPESYGLVFGGWTVYSADGSVYEGDLRYVNTDPAATIRAKANWASGKYVLAMYKSRYDYTDDFLNLVALEGRQEYVLPKYDTLGEVTAGYHFARWIMHNSNKTEEELTFEDGATVSDLMAHYYYTGSIYDEYFADVSCFVEFYAEFEQNEYTINFDGNGAQGSMESIDCLYNRKITLPDNSFTKEGYTFAGWQLGDSIFEDASDVRRLTVVDGGEVTLTARWIISYAGEGTEENPYEIDDYEKLKNLSDAVEHAKGYRYAYYKLTDDIDCAGGELNAVGYGKTFKGVFDGDGHVINNAVFAATADNSVEHPTRYKGLFASVFGGQIANVGLKDYVIDGADDCRIFAPLVCKYTSELPLQNCFAEGTISWEDSDGYFAGLVYSLCGRAVNCYTVCTFDMKYTRTVDERPIIYIGGFVGTMASGLKWDDESEFTVTQAIAENCYADAHINISAASSVEESYYHSMGLFAAIGGSFKNCFATGAITYNCGYDSLAGIRSDVNLFCGNIHFNTYDNVFVGESTQIVFKDNVLSDVSETICKTADDNLRSLEWLKQNAEFDDAVWRENAGAPPTLKAFAQ